jgi:hypothetical protein
VKVVFFVGLVVLDLHEETEAEEDLKAEYLCPFCAEDFDVVGLFCHIDEDHPVEAKNGVSYFYHLLFFLKNFQLLLMDVD